MKIMILNFHQLWVPSPLSLCLARMEPMEVAARLVNNPNNHNHIFPPGYPIHPASTSPGGGAIRTRSSERRWETSPYGGDRNYYSSSLVSTYLSPPPESRFKSPTVSCRSKILDFRWRRTHSDSALYQKLAAAQQAGGSGGASSSQGSPVQDSRQQDADVKPSQELLNSLLLREGDFLSESKVKEEPGSPHGINGNLENYSPPQLPPSPHSPLSPVSPTLQRPQYLPPADTTSSSFPNFSPAQQSALEQEFSRFRLDPPHYQDLGLMGRPQPAQEHNTGEKSLSFPVSIKNPGPTSPHTPTTLPDIYIQDYSQDWSQECEKGLLDRDFVDTLREGLEPIDDQLMAELTRSTGTFVDPAVEEQFKMNY